LKLARKARFAVATPPESQAALIDPNLLSNHGGADALVRPLVRGRPPGRPSPNAEPPRPISPAQLTANRANSQLSTGPKTETGRAISSQNRTTHGLARHNGTFVLLSSEDPIGFESTAVRLDLGGDVEVTGIQGFRRCWPKNDLKSAGANNE
jgi:hypothetical protein